MNNTETWRFINSGPQDGAFDVVAGNILYASDDQPNLTEKLLEELNKGLSATTTDGK